MGPVSGQVRRWIGEALHHWSTSRPGLAGLRRELDERDGAALAWEELTALCSRAEPLLGGRQSFVEAVRDFTAARLEAGRHELIGIHDERQAFWLASQGLGPALLPELLWSFDTPDDTHLRIEVAIPDDAPECPAFGAVLQGVLSAVPRAAGRSACRVTCASDGRRSRFEIELGPAPEEPIDTRRLTALAAHSQSVFVETDAAGVIVFVSPNAEQVFGRRPEEVVGRPFQEIARPGLQERVPEAARAILASDEPFQAEWPVPQPDGSTRWCAFTCQPFRTESGARHLVTVAHDATERREAERIRSERAALLERVARATPDAMLVIDRQSGTLSTLSEGDLSWLGLPSETFQGRSAASFDRLVHPDDLAALAAHRQRAAALAPGEVCQVQLRVRQPDGSWCWLQLRDVAFSRQEDGSPRELLVCVTDVTGPIETARSLAESRERYRRISELGSDFSTCIRIDPDGTLEREWMTEAFTRITGYPEELAGPELWEQLVHPDDRARCREASHRCLREGTATFEFRIRTAHGRIRWIRQRAEVVREPSGSLRWYAACHDVTEQREAEEARRGVEQRHRAITENAWDIIGEFDGRGLPAYVSPNLSEILGWAPEELLRSPNPELIHPDDRPRFLDHLRKLLRGSESGRIEMRVRHKQAGWRHFEVTITGYRGEDGEPRGVFVGRDVTERLHSESERERLGSLVAASSELIAIFEPDGRLVFLNRAGRRMTGLGSRALGEANLFALMELSEATRLRQEALETAVHERAWEGECQLQPLDGGDPIAVLANIFRLPEPRDDEGTRLALVARDIRARKRAENALHLSEQRFRMIVENAFDLIAELDDDGNFLYASPRYRDVLGYDPEALVGQPALDLLHEDDRDAIRELIDGNEELANIDLRPFRARTRDGSWRSIEGQVRRYRRRTGQPILIVVSRDVTDRRKTEEALRLSKEQLLQSQKMEAIGRLAGGVAHDFNNLLTAITGYGDLVYQELGEGDPLREDAAEILRAAQQASGLTRQLLAFSRRQVHQPRLVELNALVADVDRLLRRLIGERIELITSLAPDIGTLKADPGQIEQLLVNLAVNARDAMPEGGQLEIATASLELEEGRLDHPGVPAGAWVTLAVSDTGEGMSPETVERIFEPFFTTKESGEGTGLGLSTVYGIVQQNGGQIRVDSRTDWGTTFTVYLPRCEGAAEPEQPAPPQLELRGRETVVLVEPQEGLRRLLTRYLEEHGYRVIPADCGDAALEAAQRHEAPIDLLVTHLELPGMDGYALAERLSQDHPGLRTLFVSGLAETDSTSPGLDAKRHGLIQEPFSPPALLMRMRVLLTPG